MRATFVSRGWDNDARTIGSFYFKPSGRYTYTAGQYADITIPHDRPDNRGSTRTMTYASSPHEKMLRITTRIASNGSSSYKQALMALKPGDEVTLTDSMGDMILPLDASVPLVFVAGGVGIASFASILQWLLHEKDSRDVTVLYSVRDMTDVAFSKLAGTYNAFHPLTGCLYTPDVNGKPLKTWPGSVRHTRISAKEIMNHVRTDSQIYLSGSAEMVEQLRRDLQNIYKIPQYRIAYDYFDGYSTTEI